MNGPLHPEEDAQIQQQIDDDSQQEYELSLQERIQRGRKLFEDCSHKFGMTINQEYVNAELLSFVVVNNKKFISEQKVKDIIEKLENKGGLSYPKSYIIGSEVLKELGL